MSCNCVVGRKWRCSVRFRWYFLMCLVWFWVSFFVLFCCVSVCLFFFSVVLKVLCVVGLLYGENIKIHGERAGISHWIWPTLRGAFTPYSMHTSGVVSLKLYKFIKIISSKIQFGRFPYRVCSDKVLRIIYYLLWCLIVYGREPWDLKVDFAGHISYSTNKNFH